MLERMSKAIRWPIPLVWVLAMQMLAGCAGDDTAQPFDTEEGSAPSAVHTVDDLSGTMPDDRIGITPGFRLLKDVGTIASIEDDNGTILVHFAAQPGPAAIDPYLCIGHSYGSSLQCDETLTSNGEVRSVDATYLDGQSLYVGVHNGATFQTTYTLCISSFQYMPVPEGYAGIVSGACAVPSIG